MTIHTCVGGDPVHAHPPGSVYPRAIRRRSDGYLAREGSRRDVLLEALPYTGRMSVRTTSKEKTVRRDLWLIFIVSAVATLAAATLIGARDDDDGLRDAMLLGSILVVATGVVLAKGGRLLAHISRNW